MRLGLGSRWLQLGLGIVCMVTISNLQYGWTLFVKPIEAANHWGLAAIQTAFTVFILTETWLIPFEGALIDRVGPRPAVFAGGVLIGAAWTLNAYADSLALLYAAAAVGGVGAGLVYAATVGNALKWFADRRGLATGLTAAGFGAGSALTILPISGWIAAHGYQSAFLSFGIAQGLVVMAASLFLRAPSAAVLAARSSALSPSAPLAPDRAGLAREASPGEVLRSPIFYLLYVMFVLVAAGGLMATAQLAVIAADYGVAASPVSLAGLTLPALTFALSIDRVLNGLTRPFFGFVSDLIGREVTMFIAFGLEGTGILLLMRFAHDPVAFVVLSGLVFFAWGEIYSLFPALCADLFGRRHATTNYGMLYTAKGAAALLVPLGSVIKASTGEWATVFYVAAAMNMVAAALALFVVLPLRKRRAETVAKLGPAGLAGAFD